MYAMVSSVETSISLSEKIQIVSVNLLSKPLKRKSTLLNNALQK